MIKIEHLVKQYPNTSKPVVDDLNLEIEEGEICVLIGASGCGKTTTMRMINRLIPITSGKISIQGKDIMDTDPIQLRRNIGYVIQETGLFPHYTIEKNIATVPIEKKWDKKRIHDRVTELLKLIDMDESYRTKKPSALSGGQRQRVGVARALAGDPPIMLMDEPFGAIDPITRRKLQDEFLHNIQAKLHKTIVFVTHDMEEAIRMGDKIAVMQNGRLAQFGTPNEILSSPANDFVADLVGQNRMIQRLSLISSAADTGGNPIFSADQTAEILQAVKENLYVGITGPEGQPVGYIDTRKACPENAVDIDACMIKTDAHVSESQSLYTAMSVMFARKERAVFVTDASTGRALRLIDMDAMFEAGGSNG